jgi:hypothetical protein
MWEVTLKCLDNRNEAVNWTREYTREQLLKCLCDFGLPVDEDNLSSQVTFTFAEFASMYRLSIKPIESEEATA